VPRSVDRILLDEETDEFGASSRRFSTGSAGVTAIVAELLPAIELECVHGAAGAALVRHRLDRHGAVKYGSLELGLNARPRHHLGAVSATGTDTREIGVAVG